MPTQPFKIKLKETIAICCAALQTTVFAATYTANFNAGTPAGMTLYDPAKIVATGGVANSGYLSLTDAVGSQQGGAVIDDFNNGQPIGGFKATLKLLIGGGGSQPADGFSFNFGDDIADGTTGEEGNGNGLRVCLDTYDNGGGEAPALDIYWGGAVIAHTKFTGVTSLTIPPVIDPATGQAASLQTGTNFVDLIIDLKANGTLDVTYKGIPVFTNLVIADYTPRAGRFGIGARTGGAVENHWMDDLTITTVPPATGIATVKVPPATQTVAERGRVTFSVVPDGAPPFSFQWFRNNVAIQDATGSSYTIASAPAADNNARFKVKVTNAAGSVDSAEAVLTVTPDTVKPTITNVSGTESFTEAIVVFSEAISAASAGNRANYAFDGGLTINTVTVVTPTTVKLTTSRQTAGSTYNLTVNNIQDTAATPNVITANSTKTFPAFVVLKGGLRFKAFFNITGTPVQGLLDDPKFQADTPDQVGFVTQFTSRLVFPDSSHENYGGSMSGWIVPKETASYEFFIRSDDASQLFLSTDDTPANAAMIAEETGCCGAFEEPGAPETSAPQALVAGRRYYIQALWKEGGGGDYCDVAWRKVGDTAVPRALPYIQGDVLETYGPPGALTAPTVAITSPANDSSVPAGSPVVLTATASAGQDKTITQVEFFELGRSVGVVTTAPFTLTLTGLSEDAHKFIARATDSVGIFKDSAEITVSVGGLVKKLTLLAIDDKTTWRYDRSGQDLGTAWRALNYDDSKWPQGKALIADETTTTVEPIRTAISRFTDEQVYVKTFYFRSRFNFPGTVGPGVKLALRHVVDDAAVFYLNGVEIHRFGIAAGVVVDATTDGAGHENVYEGPYDIPLTALVSGENVLSVEVHQSGGSSSDVVFGAELTATIPAVTTTFVAIDDKSVWRYDRSGQDLGTAWSQKAFDDSKWPQGKALIADESTTTVEPIRTAISRFTDEQVYIKTFYFRIHFNFPGDLAQAKLKLRHVVDDGAVFYLNGVEINRLGIAAGVPVDATTDAAGHENAYEGPFDIPIASLVQGDNVLAAEVHQSGGSSSDMVFGAELSGTYFPASGGTTPDPTPPSITLRRSGANIEISWSGGGTLQTATSVRGPWTDVPGGTPQTITPTGGARFYRVSR